MLYLVVECYELGDQWECDADRVPVKLTDDKYEAFTYDSDCFEVWAIDKETGKVTGKIKEYCD